MKKILVVDDNPDILEPLCLLLEDEGYTVKTLTRGEQVYSLMQQFKPDLILLDILMSGVDGREICQKLKNDSQTKAIPVIMMSAHPTAKSTVTSYHADAFLSKPFDLDELLDTVKKFVIK